MTIERIKSMKNMKIIKRAVVLLLAVLLLAISLVSCGGGVTVDTTLTDDDTNVVEYFSRILNLQADVAQTAKQEFIAAFRGYNVFAKDFVDADVDPTKAVAVNMTAAKAALLAAAPTEEERINALTPEQMVDIIYWINLPEDQWNSKKIAETNRNENTVYSFADMMRSSEQKEAFLATKVLVAANDINFDPNQKVPTFQTAEGVALAVNVTAAKKAMEKLRPEKTADAKIFDDYLSNLTAEQVGEIVGAARRAADLTSDKFPQILLVGVGKFLGWMTKYLSFNNYVIGLLWFAILVELALIYFAIRQQKNSIKQAKLSPKERAIRKKYAGRTDQPSMQKMQQEIQKLYQEEGFNPMSGCLPMLIQLPIVIFLYQIVIDPLRYMLGMGPNFSGALTTFAQTARAAGGLGLGADAAKRGTIELLSKINESGSWGAMKSFSYFSNAVEVHDALDMSLLPNFKFLGMQTGFVPSADIWPLILVPILTFAAYFASMKVSRKLSYQPAVQDPQMGCSNKMMDITMPLMSVYVAFITPAAVGIYWIFKCLIGMLKQFILHKAMPLPAFTEEDYKRAEKEMKAKNKGKKEPVLNATDDGRVYRSLHHIDDEDDLPPRGSQDASDSQDGDEE
ncbi:MAG: YidC/Oxa1 family membrane protein insertase [Ruminococcaceae bacterium]|nr:YidC/Oxa1 family membrane protein insertase [Oscillospiraceae bacterium]